MTRKEVVILVIIALVGLLWATTAHAQEVENTSTQAATSNAMDGFLRCMAQTGLEQTCREVAGMEIKQRFPTTLSDVAMTNDDVMEGFLRCMALTGLEKSCRTVADREAARSERVAKEARKAVEKANPSPCWGCVYQPINGGNVGGYPVGGYLQPTNGVAYGGNGVASGGSSSGYGVSNRAPSGSSGSRAVPRVVKK